MRKACGKSGRGGYNCGLFDAGYPELYSGSGREWADFCQPYVKTYLERDGFCLVLSYVFAFFCGAIAFWRLFCYNRNGFCNLLKGQAYVEHMVQSDCTSDKAGEGYTTDYR